MRRRTLLLTLLGLLLLGVASQARDVHPAAASNGYTLSWWTVDGGGDMDLGTTGGGYSLSGSAGQPDAGFLGNGTYTLGTGFWCGGEVEMVLGYGVYLPLVVQK